MNEARYVKFRTLQTDHIPAIWSENPVRRIIVCLFHPIILFVCGVLTAIQQFCVDPLPSALKVTLPALLLR